MGVLTEDTPGAGDWIGDSGRSSAYDQCKQVGESLPQAGLYFLWHPGKSKVKSLRYQTNGQFAKKKASQVLRF